MSTDEFDLSLDMDLNVASIGIWSSYPQLASVTLEKEDMTLKKHEDSFTDQCKKQYVVLNKADGSFNSEYDVSELHIARAISNGVIYRYTSLTGLGFRREKLLKYCYDYSKNRRRVSLGDDCFGVLNLAICAETLLLDIFEPVIKRYSDGDVKVLEFMGLRIRSDEPYPFSMKKGRYLSLNSTGNYRVGINAFGLNFLIDIGLFHYIAFYAMDYCQYTSNVSVTYLYALEDMKKGVKYSYWNCVLLGKPTPLRSNVLEFIGHANALGLLVTKNFALLNSDESSDKNNDVIDLSSAQRYWFDNLDVLQLKWLGLTAPYIYERGKNGKLKNRTLEFRYNCCLSENKVLSMRDINLLCVSRNTCVPGEYMPICRRIFSDNRNKSTKDCDGVGFYGEMMRHLYGIYGLAIYYLGLKYNIECFKAIGAQETVYRSYSEMLKCMLLNLSHMNLTEEFISQTVSTVKLRKLCCFFNSKCQLKGNAYFELTKSLNTKDEFLCVIRSEKRRIERIFDFMQLNDYDICNISKMFSEKKRFLFKDSVVKTLGISNIAVNVSTKYNAMNPGIKKVKDLINLIVQEYPELELTCEGKIKIRVLLSLFANIYNYLDVFETYLEQE